MIRSFQHKGLKRLYDDDDPRGIFSEHVQRVKMILAQLDSAKDISHVNLPGFNLHALKGDMYGIWAITVRANWRITFRYDDANVFNVDYVD
jgi:proteic killer suppression protein